MKKWTSRGNCRTASLLLLNHQQPSSLTRTITLASLLPSSSSSSSTTNTTNTTTSTSTIRNHHFHHRYHDLVNNNKNNNNYNNKYFNNIQKQHFHTSSIIQDQTDQEDYYQKSSSTGSGSSGSSGGGGGIQNPYVKSLRKFFLKVHPDFFNDQPKFQSLNQKSFQELNEMLNWLDDYSEIALQLERSQSPKQTSIYPPENRTFVFYSRMSLNDSVVSADERQKVPSQRIESNFVVPRDFFPDFSLKSVRIITKQIDDCILSLLSQAGIAKPDFEGARAAQEGGDAAAEASRGWVFNDEPLFGGEDVSESRKRGERVNKDALREEFRMALINNTQNKSVERMKSGEWWEDDIPSVDTLVENGMLYLSRDLSLVESQKALESLRRHIYNMEFYRWSTIPVMIGPSGQYVPNEPAPGFITIPYDFDPKEFIRFLNRSIEQVNTQRKSTRERARQIQILKSQIEEELKLSKLSWNDTFVNDKGEKQVVTLKSTQILQCLESIFNSLEDIKLIYGKVLPGVHIIIGDAYKVFGSDGSIMIKWDMRATPETNELVDYFEFLGTETLKNCSRLAIAMKRLTEESKKMGNAIIDRLGCEALDVVSHSDHSIAIKFTFLKNLEQQLLFLSRYVWTDYLFVMTDDDIIMGRGKLDGVKIDTDEKRVLLPAAFTEENLVKVVDEWDKKQKKLLQGNSKDDDMDKFDNDFVRGMTLMNQIMELELKDPDFVEFYNSDVLDKDDINKAKEEDDEMGDMDDMVDSEKLKDEVDFSPEGIERLGKETMKQAYKLHDLYLEEKKMIQQYREDLIQKRRKNLEKKLLKTSDEEARLKLIEDYQRFVMAKQRSVEYRKVDIEGKIDIITQAVYDDITRMYEERQREKRIYLRKYKAFNNSQRIKQRVQLNYDLKSGDVLTSFNDLVAKKYSTDPQAAKINSVVDYHFPEAQ